MAAMKRVGVFLILAFAFFGLADSTYLTQHEINGTPLLCNVNNLATCNVVAQSPYSHFLGIPLSEYGLLFYGALFMLAALELLLFDAVLRRAIQGFALFGVISSAYFTAIQVFVINALCVYCMLSAFMALLIFVISLFIEPMRRGTPPPTLSRPPLTMPPSA